MAEPTPLVIVTGTSAGVMVSGGVDEVERSSTAPRAQSSQLAPNLILTRTLTVADVGPWRLSCVAR